MFVGDSTAVGVSACAGVGISVDRGAGARMAVGVRAGE